MNTTNFPACSLSSLHAWFSAAPDAMLGVDQGGAIVLANALAERMFDYRPDALLGLPIETLVPEQLRDLHRTHRRDYMSHPRALVMTVNHELRGAKHDGTLFPVAISLAPVTTEQGLLVIASVRDISGSWRAQQALQRARRDRYVMQIGRLALESPDYERAIQRIPELVATALEVPTVAIIATDPQRTEPRVRAATGLPAQAAETLISTFGKVQFIRKIFVPGGAEAITAAMLHDERYAPLARLLAATGFQDAVMVPLFGREEPLGALLVLAPAPADFDSDKVSFLQSVATLLSAAVQRSRSDERLAHAQRLEALGQLTGGIAHDFNNLLTVISGNLQLLEAELSERPEVREIIASALRAVDRGSALTRRLLAFARRQPLQPRAIVPQPLLEELGHMLRRTLGETITVKVECPAEVPDVYADANELDTALVNLALNARDAMPRGGRLHIAAREISVPGTGSEWKLPPGRYVAFTVSDTGTGMSPEVQTRVLEPFFTTKSADKGSGLGLSMVYGFARQSGGSLTIDSRLGYGTRVELLLPVVGTDTDKPAEVQAARSVPVEIPATILVVEDEAEVRMIAARFLRAIGYDVIPAADARQALEILAAQPRVNLLFSDVVLGGDMNGVELAHAARRAQPGLAVLLTSGYEGGQPWSPDATETFELLRKPYRREQLMSAVRRVLERR